MAIREDAGGGRPVTVVKKKRKKKAPTTSYGDRGGVRGEVVQKSSPLASMGAPDEVAIDLAPLGKYGSGRQVPTMQQTPTPADPVYAANLRNMSQAYFALYGRLPSARRTMQLMLGAPYTPQDVERWKELLEPSLVLRGVPGVEGETEQRAKPDLKEVVSHVEQGDVDWLLDMPARSEPVPGWNPFLVTPEEPVKVPAGKTITLAEMAGIEEQKIKKALGEAGDPSKVFTLSPEDPAYFNLGTSSPSYGVVPETLRNLQWQASVKGQDLSPAQAVRYRTNAVSIVEWGRWWAKVQESRGQEVTFDPESGEWTKAKDKAYRAYIFNRAMPYTIFPSDEKVRAENQQIINEVLPGLMGENLKDLTGVSRETAVLTLKNYGNALQALGVTDENVREVAYSSFAAGRIPGQSDTKVLWDYISEFGRDALPPEMAEKALEQDTTLGDMLSYPFKKVGEAYGWLHRNVGERINPVDAALEQLARIPGSVGDVFDTLERAHDWVGEKGVRHLIEGTPFMYATEYAEHGATTGADVFWQAKKKASGGDVSRSWKSAMTSTVIGTIVQAVSEGDADSIFAAHSWAESWDRTQGKMLLGYTYEQVAPYYGRDPDDQSWKLAMQIADFALIMLVAKKMDVGLRAGARAGARYTFKAGRWADITEQKAAARVKPKLASEVGEVTPDFLTSGLTKKIRGLQERKQQKGLTPNEEGTLELLTERLEQHQRQVKVRRDAEVSAEAAIGAAETAPKALRKGRVTGLEPQERLFPVEELAAKPAKAEASGPAMPGEARIPEAPGASGAFKVGDDVSAIIDTKTEAKQVGKVTEIDPNTGDLKLRTPDGEELWTAENMSEKLAPEAATVEAPPKEGPFAGASPAEPPEYQMAGPSGGGTYGPDAVNAPPGSPYVPPEWMNRSWFQSKAEWVAWHTKSGDGSGALISKLLGLPDNPERVNHHVELMQAADTPAAVLDIITRMDREGMVTVDPHSAAIFRIARTNARENVMRMAGSLGPVGNVVAETVRMGTTAIMFQREMPFRRAPDHLLDLAHSVKMGRKKMRQADFAEARDLENRMWKAKTIEARQGVLDDFTSRIRENMEAEGTWVRFEAFESTLRARRADWITKNLNQHLGRRAYAERPGTYQPARTVAPDWARRQHARRAEMERKLEKLREAGETDEVAAMERAVRDADALLADYMEAARAYTDAQKNPGKYPATRGGAPNERVEWAEHMLDSLGSEQPIWTFQLQNKMLSSIDPRMLAWFQSGKAARFYLRDIDATIGERVTRTWKQWTLASTGFPLRVYAGDEFWRLPMEGIGPRRAVAARATVRRLRGGEGALTRSEKALFRKLDGKRKEKVELTSDEQTQLAALDEKMAPQVSPEVSEALQDKMAKDFGDLMSDEWDLVGPEAGHPQYLTAMQDVMRKLSREPLVKEWLERGKGRDAGSIRSFLEELILEDSQAGEAIRELLVRTHRITSRQADRAVLRTALREPSAGAYRSVHQVVDIWTDQLAHVSRDPNLMRALKRGDITTEELQQAQKAGNLFPIPVQRGMVRGHGIPSYFNVGGRLYEHMTLPLLTWMGRNVREVLFGDLYNTEYARIVKNNPKVDKAWAAQEAAERAAAAVETKTFSRSATVLEDISRNAIPFVNSYRQFWAYWTKAALTQPFLMGTIWSQTPEMGATQAGWLQMYLQSLTPFFLQGELGEERDKSAYGLGKAILQPPNFNPFIALMLAGLAKTTGTRGDISQIPGMESSSRSMAPLSKPAGFMEGFFGWDVGLLGRDYEQAQADYLDILRSSVEGQGEPVGEELEVELPWPVGLAEKLGAHNPALAVQAMGSVFSPVSVKVLPEITATLRKEKAGYYDLLDEGEKVKAAEYLEKSKYLGTLHAFQTTTDASERNRIAKADPWVVDQSGSNYEWTTDGTLLWNPEWGRKALDRATLLERLRNRRTDYFGGLPTEDGEFQPAYPGDIKREEMLPKMKAQLKDIRAFARDEAERIAEKLGGGKAMADDLFEQWESRTAHRIRVDEQGNTVWDEPAWYTKALRREKKDPEEWHPGHFTENQMGVYGEDYRGGPYKPSEADIRLILNLQEQGLVGAQLSSTMIDGSVWSNMVAKTKQKFLRQWREDVMDIEGDAFYSLDSTILKRIGFDVTPALDAAILKVRAYYYGDKMAAYRDNAATREGREQRNRFYAYKDRVFGKVKGGEFLVGGLPERILHTPWLADVPTTLPTKQEQLVWRAYLKEAQRADPNMKLIRQMRQHFTEKLADKYEDFQHANDWVLIAATAQHFRHEMKTSWSDYYQGPGNSAYSNAGKKKVAELAVIIKDVMEDNLHYGDGNAVAEDIKDYFGTPRKLAWNLCEWYYH